MSAAIVVQRTATPAVVQVSTNAAVVVNSFGNAIAISGIPLNPTAPTDGQIPSYDLASNTVIWSAVSAGAGFVQTSGDTMTGDLVMSASDVLPFADSTGALGVTGTRWANVWADQVDVTAALNVGGNIAAAGVGPHVFGGAVSVNTQWMLTGAFTATTGGTLAAGMRVSLDLTASNGHTGTQALFMAGGGVGGSITTQSNSESVAVVATAHFSEPAITEGTDTVAIGATVFIADAPDEGTDNASLWVNAGLSRFVDVTVTGTTILNTALAETSGGTNQSTYATGDLLYSDATDSLVKLAIGTNGQVLAVSSGGIVEWVAAGGGGVTDHGALTGLADDDHSNYMHISVARTITALHIFSHASGISIDDIVERTATAGVTVDGVLLKDGLVSATGSGVNVFVADTEFGPTPATAGGIRMTNADWIRSRNAADSGNVDLIQADGTDRVVVGNGAIVLIGGDISIPIDATIGLNSSNILSWTTSDGVLLTGAGGINLILDANNNQSGAKLTVRHNGEALGSSAELFSIEDNGNVVMTGTLTGLTSIPQAIVTAHEAALTILETQVSDGSVLARVAGTETITGLWDFTHASGLKIDDIVESSAAAGVTIDGLLIKDAGIPQAAVTAHEAALTILTSQLSGVVAEANGGTNQSTFTTGDVLYSDATNSLAKLAIGTNGQILAVSSGGIVEWVAAGAPSDHGGLTGLADDDHANYVHISIARTITALHIFSHASGISIDDIIERTATAGVTIDGLLIKDAGIPQAAVTAHEAALTILTSQLSGVVAEANGGTNQSTYATGDLLYSDATNSLLKLAIGTNGQILAVSSGGIVEWVSAGAPTDHGGLTGLADDDHANYMHISIARTVTALHIFSHASGISIDDIIERTAAAGVTIDGLLIKDAGIPQAAVTAHEAALTILTSQLSGVVPEANGGTDQSTYATGDLLYATGTNALGKRTVGSTADVLTVAGGVPTWAAPVIPPKNIGYRILAVATATAIADGVGGTFAIGSEIDGWNLTGVHAYVDVAGTTNTLDIQIHNLSNALDMLSTVLTVDSAETSSLTAATAAVINTSNDHVNEGDLIRIDIDAIHTTPATGCHLVFTFSAP